MASDKLSSTDLNDLFQGEVHPFFKAFFTDEIFIQVIQTLLRMSSTRLRRAQPLPLKVFRVMNNAASSRLWPSSASVVWKVSCRFLSSLFVEISPPERALFLKPLRRFRSQETTICVHDLPRKLFSVGRPRTHSSSKLFPTRIGHLASKTPSKHSRNLSLTLMSCLT